MDLKTRLEIIDKIRACPQEKCGNLHLRTRSAKDYDLAKETLIRIIETMNDDRQVIFEDEKGEQQLVTLNLNQLFGFFDPIVIDE